MRAVGFYQRHGVIVPARTAVSLGLGIDGLLRPVSADA
jgi:hypothetical protein